MNNAPPDGVGVVFGGSDVETAGPLPTVENTKHSLQYYLHNRYKLSKISTKFDL